MSGNRKYLIRHLTGTTLGDRFSGIVPINCDETGMKRGNGGTFSLVFKAIDKTTNQPVAIKFFDPDDITFMAMYRRAAFKRESELLETLKDSERCLHLVQPLHELKVQVTNEEITLTYCYFVLEWLDGDIQDYFEKQETFEAIAKLQVFRECLLGVFALHNREIFHRDLKPDNLMQARRMDSQVVVAIDLGTAAKLDSTTIGSDGDYYGPVGALIFAPPEAWFGLAAIRTIGVAADVYALGCLLHDLFNLDNFYYRLLGDRGYALCRVACERHMYVVVHGKGGALDADQLMAEWRKIIRQTKGQVTLPGISDAPDSTTPAAVRDILNHLLASTVAIDLEDRQTDSRILLRRVDTAIKILQNDIADKQVREKRAARRNARIARARIKAERLQQYLTSKS